CSSQIACATGAAFSWRTIRMKTEVSVEILRPAECIWSVLMDVERWPDWTASITSIDRLDQAPFGMGSSVSIRQPTLKTVTWRVSEFVPGRLFTWKTDTAGMSTIARHTIQPREHGCIVTHTIEHEGRLALLLEPFFRRLTQRYVEMEAQGLKKKCEEVTAVA